MTEIKFKGKRKDNGEWVEGTYHYCAGPGKMRFWDIKNGNRVFEDRDVEFNSHWILVPNKPDEPGWDVRDTFMPHAVIPETVGQYTGLQDKNGKDIYEGDIYKNADGGRRTCQVFFLAGAFVGGKSESSCMPLGWDGIMPDADQNWIEVIGNIHENHELLNQ